MLFKRWDQFTTTVNIKDDNGDAVDITWATVYFTVREKQHPIATTDDDAIITKDITEHTDPANGETELELTSSDTDIDPGDYYREIQVKFASWDIISTTTSKLIVVQDLTKRTS